MKKSLFTLFMLLISMTLMAQSSRHRRSTRSQSSSTVYYVMVKAFTNLNEAQWFNNNAPYDTEFGGIHTVIANGKKYYLVRHWAGPYKSKASAEKARDELQSFFNNVWSSEDIYPFVWATKSKAKSETVGNKATCDCDMCGPEEKSGRCHRKGRWVIAEGALVFRCSYCDEWGEGCDCGCECRIRDKVHSW